MPYNLFASFSLSQNVSNLCLKLYRLFCLVESFLWSQDPSSYVLLSCIMPLLFIIIYFTFLMFSARPYFLQQCVILFVQVLQLWLRACSDQSDIGVSDVNNFTSDSSLPSSRASWQIFSTYRLKIRADKMQPCRTLLLTSSSSDTWLSTRYNGPLMSIYLTIIQLLAVHSASDSQWSSND